MKKYLFTIVFFGFCFNISASKTMEFNLSDTICRDTTICIQSVISLNLNLLCIPPEGIYWGNSNVINQTFYPDSNVVGPNIINHGFVVNGDTINRCSFTITVPDLPDIWLFGYNLLVCSDSLADTYEWYDTNDKFVVKSTLSYYYCQDTSLSGEIYVRTCHKIKNSEELCCTDSRYFKFSQNNGSIKSEPSVAQFSVYPNPATSRIFIHRLLPVTDNYSYHVFDVYGNRYSAGNCSGIESAVDISGLAAGVYFIRIEAGAAGNETYKIIKTW